MENNVTHIPITEEVYKELFTQHDAAKAAQHATFVFTFPGEEKHEVELNTKYAGYVLEYMQDVLGART